MKIRLFTHTDLDGLGCHLVLKPYTADEDVYATYCEPSNINEKVMEFLEGDTVKDYDYLLISDLSVNEQVAGILERLHHEDGISILLLDHHKTAEWLDAYEWAHVYSTENVYDSEKEQEITQKTCATQLVFKHFVRDVLQAEVTSFEEDFVELVRRYDTWEWHDRFNDTKAKQLNDLLNIYGQKRFMKDMTKQLSFSSDPFYAFTQTDRVMLEIHQEEIDRYIQKKEQNMQVRTISGYEVGIIVGERFFSEMGNVVAAKRPELDIVMMMNLDGGFASVRTVKDEVDVSAFAKALGGGGHPKASGFPLDPRIKPIAIALQFPELLAQ